jgi:hypothetical protein
MHELLTIESPPGAAARARHRRIGLVKGSENPVWSASIPMPVSLTETLVM